MVAPRRTPAGPPRPPRQTVRGRKPGASSPPPATADMTARGGGCRRAGGRVTVAFVSTLPRGRLRNLGRRPGNVLKTVSGKQAGHGLRDVGCGVWGVPVPNLLSQDARPAIKGHTSRQMPVDGAG